MKSWFPSLVLMLSLMLSLGSIVAYFFYGYPFLFLFLFFPPLLLIRPFKQTGEKNIPDRPTINFCPQCGSKISPEWKYCPYCSANIDDS